MRIRLPRTALFTKHDFPYRAGVQPRRRSLHLAPPFLIDDYTPRYMALSSIDAAKKRSKAYGHLRNCNLCPRLCGVNRYETTGMCLIGDKAKVNVIAPHFGEGKYLPDLSICPAQAF
jgi:putative pyruvate formate lyase activating enzyme